MDCRGDVERPLAASRSGECEAASGRSTKGETGILGYSARFTPSTGCRVGTCCGCVVTPIGFGVNDVPPVAAPKRSFGSDGGGTEVAGPGIGGRSDWTPEPEREVGGGGGGTAGPPASKLPGSD